MVIITIVGNSWMRAIPATIHRLRTRLPWESGRAQRLACAADNIAIAICHAMTLGSGGSASELFTGNLLYFHVALREVRCNFQKADKGNCTKNDRIVPMGHQKQNVDRCRIKRTLPSLPSPCSPRRHIKRLLINQSTAWQDGWPSAAGLHAF